MNARMNILTAHQLLTIVAWFLMTIVVGFVMLIARFYEDVTGERTFYVGYAVPIFCFAGASAREAFNNALGDDLFANVLWLIGGTVLALLSVYLYNLMIAARPTEATAADTKDGDGNAL